MLEVERNIKDGKVRILGLKPSQVPQVDPDQSGLNNLFDKVYGLNISENGLDDEVFWRLRWGDGVRQLFFAFDNERAVGMLGLCKADTLAHSLQPSRRRALSADETTALASVYEVSDTMVLPDYRRRGVATVLWQEAVRELKPDIIVGQTNNPDQVLARSSALVGLDFRTFYGIVETTPTGPQEQTSEHEQIRQAAVAYLGGVSDERSVWTHGLFSCFLKPTLPDLSSYPRYIQTAFAPVNALQDRSGDKRVAISSLISVNRKFLA